MSVTTVKMAAVGLLIPFGVLFTVIGILNVFLGFSSNRIFYLVFGLVLLTPALPLYPSVRRYLKQRRKVLEIA